MGNGGHDDSSCQSVLFTVVQGVYLNIVQVVM